MQDWFLLFEFRRRVLEAAAEGHGITATLITPDRMLSLNGDELKILIAELRGRTDMDDEMRKGMIGFSIMMLAQEHPEKALAIFTESSDLLEDNPMREHVLSSSLTQRPS